MRLRLGLVLLLLLTGCSQNNAPASSSSTAAPTATIDPATTATISGVITLAGTPPVPQPIDMSQDPACVIGSVPKNFGEAYTVNKDRLQNVYVYIKSGLIWDVILPPPPRVILDQKGCKYAPHVIGLQVGQTLEIDNHDPTIHNIHSMAHENDGWNVSQYPGGEAIERIFAKPEVMVPVQCNNHPWMKMYVNVSSHPFFAVSDSGGKFTISGLPPGTYTLAAVHEKMGEKTMQITVGVKDTKTADFKFTSSDSK